MPEQSEVQRDLEILESELKRLEAEYNMFFSGRAPRPPLETRRRVETIVRLWDRGHIETAGDRFRVQTLDGRFQKFVELWDRGLRAREEGRPGPFAQPPPKAAPKKEQQESNKGLYVTPCKAPMHAMDRRVWGC